MIRFAVLVAFAGAFFRSGFCRSVDTDEASRAVSNWIRQNPHPLETRTLGLPEIDRVHTVSNEAGRALFHVVESADGGTVIVAPDTRLEPIVSFWDGHDFEESEASPFFGMLVADMSSQCGRIEKDETASGEESLTEAEKAWKKLLTRQIRLAANGYASLADVRVPYLVQSQWNQSYVGTKPCYNYYTPNNSYCGCVPCAEAQIMRFHQWPRHYVVPATDEWPTFRGGYYDWANMPLVPTEDITEAECQAIGKLCSDVGLTLYTSYGTSGSSSSFLGMVYSLRDIFGYASAMGYENQVSNMTDDEVQRTCFANFDAGYPVGLGVAGHVVVADGYGYQDGEPYTHLNMGWGGSGSAWYRLPNVNTGSYKSDYQRAVVYNIFPSHQGEILSGRVTDISRQPVANLTISVSYAGGRQQTTTNERGIYSFFVPSDVTCTVSFTCDEVSRSRTVVMGRSVSTTTAKLSYSVAGQSIGNVWGVDFITADGVDLAAETAMLSMALDEWQGLSAVDGSAPICLHLAISNIGSESPDGTFELAHELWSAGNQLLNRQVNAYDAPAAGDRLILNVEAPGFMQNLRNGEYVYKCVVNPDQTVGELTYENNSKSWSFKVDKPLPDLVADPKLCFLSASATDGEEPTNVKTVFVGETIHVHTGYRNDGTRDFIGRISVRHELYDYNWKLLESCVQTDVGENAAAGARVTCSSYTPNFMRNLSRGTYRYKWTIVAEDNVEERSTNNNSDNFTFTVGVIPELVADGTRCFLSESPEGEIEPTVNLQTSFTNDSIYAHTGYRNTGDYTSGMTFNITHRLYDWNWTLLATQVLTNAGEVAVKGTTVVSQPFIPEFMRGLAKGTYRYYWTLDAEGALGEANTGNNSDSFTFSTDVPLAVTRGESAQMTVAWCANPLSLFKSYTIQSRKSGNAHWTSVKTITVRDTTNFTDTASTIVGGQRYEYRMRVKHGTRIALLGSSTKDYYGDWTVAEAYARTEIVPATNRVELAPAAATPSVAIAANCYWRAEVTVGKDWLTLSTVGQQTKSTTLKAAAVANDGVEPRVGVITLTPVVETGLENAACDPVLIEIVQEASAPSVPQPTDAWWNEHPGLMAVLGASTRREAAEMQSPGRTDSGGKFKSDGVTPMYVWEDYVAGTNPYDPDSLLRAIIEMKDGVPVLTWSPALNDTETTKGVKTGIRTYRVWGSTDLKTWTECGTDISSYRFFRVTVEMPPE